MKLYVILYMLAITSIFLAERSFEGTIRYTLVGIGLAGFTAAFILCLKEAKAVPEDRRGTFHLPLCFMGLGLLAFGLYALTLDASLQALSLEAETEHRFTTIIHSLWPIVATSSILPFLGISQLLMGGSKHSNQKRANKRIELWLSAALAISMLVPLNYVAHDTNVRWDLGYFKTTSPGSSTLTIIDSLTEPVYAYLFFPPSSDVRQEIRSYFDQIDSPNLPTVYLDRDTDDLPEELAAEFKKSHNKSKGNGYILLFKKPKEENKEAAKSGKQNARFIKIGTQFSRAKTKLKNLDEEVRKGLINLTKEKGVIYITAGHGEMHWKTSSEQGKEQKIATLKRILSAERYKVAELGLTDGLSSGVPDDANLVMILGPQGDFLDAEVDALNKYRATGGALLVALEPQGNPMDGLLKPLGMTFDADSRLLNKEKFIPLSRKISLKDQQNLVTNKYSTHPAVSSLSKYRQDFPLMFSGAGALSKDKKSKAKTIIRSMEKTWNDVDGDLKLNTSTQEKQKVWDIALAVEQSSTPKAKKDAAEKSESSTQKSTSKMIVVADSSWLGDLWLNAVLRKNSYPPNALALRDMLGWLIDDPTTKGTVNNEKDIKIKHSKDGQGWIFYCTVLLVPIALFLLGSAMVNRRKRKV